MKIGEFWIGQKPSRPLVFNVRDERGRVVDLSMYTNVRVRIVGTDNEEIDLTGATAVFTNKREGRITFYWPSVSIFEKPGEYLVQLELSNPVVLDMTTPWTIEVHKLGEVS